MKLLVQVGVQVLVGVNEGVKDRVFVTDGVQVEVKLLVQVGVQVLVGVNDGVLVGV